jgi:hypothetical protein
MALPYSVSRESKKMSELLAEEYDDSKTSRTAPASGIDIRVKAMAPLPLMPAKPSDAEIKDLIKAIPVFKPAASVVNKRVGPADVLPPVNTLLKSMMSWMIGRQDSTFYSTFQIVGYEQKIPEKEMDRLRAYVDARLWAGGTVQGMYSRLLAGFSGDRPEKLQLHLEPTLKWLMEVMPVDWAKLPDLTRPLSPKDYEHVDINFKSSAGAPFLAGVRKSHFSKIKTTYSVAKAWFEQAQQIASAAHKFEDLQKFVKENEDLFTATLANKYSLMERADLLKKVRPYYRFPAAASFLFQVYTQPLQDAVFGFWEDKGSASALKFSWSGGGLRRLQTWARACKDGFSFLFYGDDLLFLFKINGKVYVSAPDCQFMDMTLIKDWVKVCGGFTSRSYGKKFGELWMNILSLHMKLAWSPKVILEKAYTVLKASGLCSGIVGTTLFDNCASGVVCREFKLQEDDAKGVKIPADLEKWSTRVWAMVKEKLGLVLKPGTGKWVEWDVERVPLPVKFLGYSGLEIKLRVGGDEKTKKYETFWVPSKPAEEWLATLSYTPTDERDGIRDATPPVVVRLSSLFGVYFSGGYVHRLVAEAIKRLYMALRDTPGAGFKPYSAGIDMDQFDFSFLAGQTPWLPDREKMARFYSEEKIVPLNALVHGYTPTHESFKRVKTKAEIEQGKEEQYAANPLEDLRLVVGSSGVSKGSKVAKFPIAPTVSDKHFGVKPPDLEKRKQREERKAQHDAQMASIRGLEERNRDKRFVELEQSEDVRSVSERSTDLKWQDEAGDIDEPLSDFREMERNKEHDKIIDDPSRDEPSEEAEIQPDDEEPALW